MTRICQSHKIIDKVAPLPWDKVFIYSLIPALKYWSEINWIFIPVNLENHMQYVSVWAIPCIELIITVIIIWMFDDINMKIQLYDSDIKRKQACVGGKELVSLSCNREFIFTGSVGRGWCKVAFATMCCQFLATDKCGILLCRESLTNTHLGKNTELTSCAHKWGQYTPALITTHLIKKIYKSDA